MSAFTSVCDIFRWAGLTVFVLILKNNGFNNKQTEAFLFFWYIVHPLPFYVLHLINNKAICCNKVPLDKLCCLLKLSENTLFRCPWGLEMKEQNKIKEKSHTLSFCALFVNREKKLTPWSGLWEGFLNLICVCIQGLHSTVLSIGHTAQ